MVNICKNYSCNSGHPQKYAEEMPSELPHPPAPPPHLHHSGISFHAHGTFLTPAEDGMDHVSCCAKVSREISLE